MEDVQKPVEIFASCRDKILDLMERMLTLDRGKSGRVELQKLVTEGSVLFIEFREANRQIMEEEESAKQETEAAKLPVEKAMSQLNNLLYEKNHYLKAIKACKDYKTQYPGIELVSEDDFFKNAPDEFKSDPELRQNPRKLMLQRLAYELHQRKEGVTKREQLQLKVRTLQSEVNKKRKTLENLPRELKALRTAVEPIQKELGLDRPKRLIKHPSVELLPTPLYVLYSQFLSYKDSFTEPIEVEIRGNVKEAEALASLEAATARATAGTSGRPTSPEDEARDDDDQQAEDEDGPRRRKKRHHSHHSLKSSPTESNAKAYVPHPLSVFLNLYDEIAGGGGVGAEEAEGERKLLLSLKFEYLRNLKVVVVGVEGPGALAGDVALLGGLYQNDLGADTPNEAAELAKEGLPGFDPSRKSRPYKWAQRLAGLDPPPQGVDHLAAGLVAYRQQFRLRLVLQKLWLRARSYLPQKPPAPLPAGENGSSAMMQ